MQSWKLRIFRFSFMLIASPASVVRAHVFPLQDTAFATLDSVRTWLASYCTVERKKGEPTLKPVRIKSSS